MKKTVSRLLAAVMVYACNASLLSAADGTLDHALDVASQRTKADASAQQKINKLDDEIRTKVIEFKQVSKEVEGLEVYTEQLQRQLQSQQTEMQDIEESIRQVTLIERNITPLMLRMLEALEQFVDLDVPFQHDERKQKVASLRAIIDRSDVKVAEKFRKVLETYLDEIEYGKTIDARRGSLEIDGQMREVDYLRVGRVGWMYSTLDGKSMGAWNSRTQQWESLPASYQSSMTRGLRIAREQAAPDLIRVPVVAAAVAE